MLATEFGIFHRNGGDYPAFIDLVRSLLSAYASPEGHIDPEGSIFSQNNDVVSLAETIISLEDEFAKSLNISDADMVAVSIKQLAMAFNIKDTPQ